MSGMLRTHGSLPTSKNPVVYRVSAIRRGHCCECGSRVFSQAGQLPHRSATLTCRRCDIGEDAAGHFHGHERVAIDVGIRCQPEVFEALEGGKPLVGSKRQISSIRSTFSGLSCFCSDFSAEESCAPSRRPTSASASSGPRLASPPSRDSGYPVGIRSRSGICSAVVRSGICFAVRSGIRAAVRPGICSVVRPRRVPVVARSGISSAGIFRVWVFIRGLGDVGDGARKLGRGRAHRCGLRGEGEF
jgi:hypothetical protein